MDMKIVVAGAKANVPPQSQPGLELHWSKHHRIIAHVPRCVKTRHDHELERQTPGRLSV